MKQTRKEELEENLRRARIGQERARGLERIYYRSFNFLNRRIFFPMIIAPVILYPIYRSWMHPSDKFQLDMLDKANHGPASIKDIPHPKFHYMEDINNKNSPFRPHP